MKTLLHAALLLSVCFAQACVREAEVALDVDFRKSGHDLIIENKNPFDYKDLDAVVNERFHYRVASLKANEKLRVPLDSFATPEGTRFPATGKLSSMTLHAVTADGNGNVE